MKTSNNKIIFHVVQHLAPGGLESLVLDFMTFAQPGTEVYVVSIEGTKHQAIANWPKLAAHKDNLVFLNKAPGFQGHVYHDLVRLFRAMKVDVVHTHHIGPLLYGGTAAKHAKVPVRLHTEHDVWHLSKRKSQLMQSMLLKHVQPQLVADAFRVGEQLDKLFQYPKLSCIPNGIDVSRFKPGSKVSARLDFAIDAHDIVIGSAGRLESVKGHDVLIKAMRYVPSHIKLVIAGDGSQREELTKLITKLHLEDRVRLLGRVDNMARFYQALDVFCLPSRHEGYPLTALEAQACGIHTVVTDVGSSSETLCPHTGALVKPNRIIALALGLEQKAAGLNQQSPRDHVVANNDIRHMVAQYDVLAREGEAA